MLHQQTSVENPPRPLISFIIPCYNEPREMLTDCIESILSLPLRSEEREVIVVDDGSAAPIATFLAPYGEALQLLRQDNLGLAAARNAALECARGTYVQFVDSDDRLIPSQYSHVICEIKNRRPDILLFGWTRSEHFRECSACRPMTDGVSHLLKNNIQGSACHYVFRFDLLGSLRFPVGLFHEDEAFTPLLFLRAKTLLPTDITAYFYRRCPSSITTRRSRAHFETRLNHLLAVIKRLRDETCHLKGNASKALDRRVSQLTMDYIYQAVMLLRSRKDLFSHVRLLKTNGLYPLPVRRYTLKYFFFSLLANTSAGLCLLRLLLPLAKPEE